MDLERLRKFITVVEAGAIGSAAHMLHISQPALSRQVRLLEEEVGLTLLERVPRGIQLTPAGEEFLIGARKLLEESVRMVADAVQASKGDLGGLAVGTSECYTFHPNIISSIRDYVALHPGVRFRFSSLESGDILQQVDCGILDGGFVINPQISTSTLNSLLVFKDKVSLAVSSMSPLGQRHHCDLSAIDGANLVLVSQERKPWFYEFLIHILHERGISPRMKIEGDSHSAIIAFVAAGMGCALVPSAARLAIPPDVTLLEIDDSDLEVDVSFIWRAQNRSLPLARYILLLQKTTF